MLPLIKESWGNYISEKVYFREKTITKNIKKLFHNDKGINSPKGQQRSIYSKFQMVKKV